MEKTRRRIKRGAGLTSDGSKFILVRSLVTSTTNSNFSIQIFNVSFPFIPLSCFNSPCNGIATVLLCFRKLPKWQSSSLQLCRSPDLSPPVISLLLFLRFLDSWGFCWNMDIWGANPKRSFPSWPGHLQLGSHPLLEAPSSGSTSPRFWLLLPRDASLRN